MTRFLRGKNFSSEELTRFLTANWIFIVENSSFPLSGEQGRTRQAETSWIWRNGPQWIRDFDEPQCST